MQEGEGAERERRDKREEGGREREREREREEEGGRRVSFPREVETGSASGGLQRISRHFIFREGARERIVQ
jgi:hypothetical protein